MSEMVERVARTIYDNRFGLDGLEFLEDEPWKAAIDTALAVIASMREPTDEMREAWKQFEPTWDCSIPPQLNYQLGSGPGSHWQAGIDAVLK